MLNLIAPLQAQGQNYLSSINLDQYIEKNWVAQEIQNGVSD
jgi:hypothetical protein